MLRNAIPIPKPKQSFTPFANNPVFHVGKPQG